MRELDTLAAVALLEDTATPPLRRGQVGTVVERLAPGVYEVEFGDDEGRTLASVALGRDQLLPVHHQHASDDLT
jgi:hypothetical protein